MTTPIPQSFLDSLAPFPELDVLRQSLDTPPEVSVRINAARGAVLPAEADTVPWCPEGMYLPDRPVFTFDPALHQGLYYVQDASSMAMSLVARTLTADGAPVRWLDVCAAPGGKTTAAAAALPQGSLVVANEYDRKRAGALVENVLRWGNPAVMVTTGEAARFSDLTDFFDVIAVDAPCSGEGMMRKEEVARSQWSARLVESCSRLQRQIISHVWPALRPGGFLVYSTCTFNVHENEENTLWIMDTFGAECLTSPLAHFPGVMPALEPYRERVHSARFIPGRVRGEGLYMAILRKPLSHAPARTTVTLSRKFKNTPMPAPWVNAPVTGVTDRNGLISAIPEGLAAEMLAVSRVTLPLVMGTPVALPKGRDFIPAYGLACSSLLNREAFPSVDVDAETALEFLRGVPVELTHLPDRTANPFILLSYQGHPLGFVKNLGRRVNNLLPDAHRIRAAAPVPVSVLS